MDISRRAFLTSTAAAAAVMAMNPTGALAASSWAQGLAQKKAVPKIQASLSSSTTNDQLKMMLEMGITNCNLNVSDSELTYDVLARIVDRIRRAGFTILDAGCGNLQKNQSIILGLSDKDANIQKFQNYIPVLAKLGIPITWIAWQPNGIVRTKGLTNKYTHGGSAGIADMAKIKALPLANGRVYTEQEMWGNFKYFIDKMLPVLTQNKVALALHPNDPPVPSLQGAYSLIYNSNHYRKAFALANNSPYLGMKMCIGCWLEGGVMFGDVMKDIAEFVPAGKVLNVHFRNVSNPLNRDYSGYFEEVLCQDGYADMYAIMKQLVRYGYKGGLFCDHAFSGYTSNGGNWTNMATNNAYIMGLITAAAAEVK
ncbi:mannonate dehydratase [Sporomusa acidovorans]|uniref:mannonate dehydratase n=1 Tax=Sporomusa acidovorans (strain ATCC 49682 / DSM 3132 / Mol) TaxID=1123286 RepID=A0ABZ3J6Q3_SPOA4|nr:mannonate dehydratase [Sporomusa acidovorans]OZC24207.1 mannonate dehydratase [Sporomusa acidovorans DSM 3132]SDF77204.1 D-mannonate dehydratase [Sporomusa acidovorans]